MVLHPRPIELTKTKQINVVDHEGRSQDRGHRALLAGG
jgi:hypothetical protein